MHMAALFVGYWCLASLVVVLVWLAAFTAARASVRVDMWVFEARRQITLFRRLLADRHPGKTVRACWDDATPIRRHANRIVAETEAENHGLTIEQIEFRDAVELELLLLPTCEEAA